MPSGRLFAAAYPWIAARADAAGLGALRDELLAGASGLTLEVGPGHGANLDRYPDAVTELVLCEPSPFMLARLVAAAGAAGERRGGGAWSQVIEAPMERLPFAEATFDTVVCTLALCSVHDVPTALRELARVLRPGGRLLVLEHVRADDGTALARAQDLLRRPHQALAGGCRPNRRTEALLRAAPGLTLEWLRSDRQPALLALVRPIVLGALRRTA